MSWYVWYQALQKAASGSDDLREAFQDLAQAHHRSTAHDLPAKQQAILSEFKSHVRFASAERSPLHCPQCGEPCAAIIVASISVDTCHKCGGMWFDAGELRQLTELPVDIPGEALRHRPSKFACPICHEIMTEFQFWPGENLLVDSCGSGHGIFLKKDELARALRIATADHRLGRDIHVP